uniref:Beta-1,4-N-acetylgalactosaminyltransferase bre-4 n=1 Tax=Plectus sambesii TaxID=2011161 RepID=A0A914UIM1_9BILA
MITEEHWLSEVQLSERLTDIGPAGNWRPEHCIARSRLAIIIPFRNRSDHLPRLLSSLIPILKRQLIDFRFIVAEQFGDHLFNKGRLMNAAFTVAEMLKVDCVIFHDVDLFPTDDRNPYGCPLNPRHVGAFVDTLGYELPYNYLAGGVLAIRTEQFKSINGYSNVYWGWGGEDDDIGKRIVRSGLVLERPDTVHGRMTMLKHEQRWPKSQHLVYVLHL